MSIFKVLAAGLSLALASTAADAATLTNRGDAAIVVIVTEDGQRSEIQVQAAQTLQFCLSGCFATFPNGERHALTGTETVEADASSVLVR